ncbi:MAG: hypothetical protein KAQ68_10400 [Clostridiales bacterium]|nr:hypothetical protein [Clostridiales bacterium]
MTNSITIIVSISSLIIAIFSVVYTVVSNREKFVITSSEREKILDWYEKVNKIIIELNHRLLNNDDTNRLPLLSELSALIEVGRFYFPNVDEKDGFGDYKPLAYRGYRNLVLEFLVYIYQIGNHKDATLYTEHIDILRKEFTSSIYAILNPKKYLMKLRRNSYITMRSDAVLNDFLYSDNPNSYVFTEIQ